MTTGFIDIDIVGGRKSVDEMLDHLDSAMSPVGMSIFLSGRVSPFLRERAKARFRDEGDDAVGKWAPLSATTAMWREAYGFSPHHPINRRTGALEDYITGAPSDVVAGVGLATLKFPGGEPADKWTREKLRTAQRGKESPSTRSRPVLGMGETDLLYVLEQLALHIQGWDSRIA